MKIIIASTIVPFIKGGGNFIVEWTAKKLSEAGHEVEVFKIPFNHRYSTIIEQMVSLQSINIKDKCDRLISIRTPSYLLEHENHIAWFIHHYRLAYELWNTSLQTEIPLTPEGYQFRDAIINADNIALRRVKKLYTNSKEISGRLKEYNKLKSEVLYPPLMDQDEFHCKEYGDYIYYSSRLSPNKRQILAIEAMRYTTSNVKLVVTGFPDAPEVQIQLEDIIQANNLEDKVTLIPRWISKEEKIEFFAKCLAGIYIPLDEDSYGYPTLEAFASKKCVITCIDSGGTDEIISNNINGYITESTPENIAQAMDKLYNSKQLAKKMGEEAYTTLLEKGITWENLIHKLTMKL